MAPVRPRSMLLPGFICSIHYNTNLVFLFKEIIEHRDFQALPITENDIALLVLAENVTWNEAYNPVCQPSRGVDAYANETGTCSGWGVNVAGE